MTPVDHSGWKFVLTLSGLKLPLIFIHYKPRIASAILNL